MSSQYEASVSTNFPNGYNALFTPYINETMITNPMLRFKVIGDLFEIHFTNILSASDITTLQGLLSNYVPANTITESVMVPGAHNRILGIEFHVVLR